MKTKHLKIMMLIVLVVIFCTPPCLAKTKGFFYVVAYSYRDKKVYCSPIFVEKVKDAYYSDEEYCTDVGLLQKIEAAFNKYLADIVGGKLTRYTMSSRGAYKSYAIAKKQQDAEKKDFGNKGLKVENTTQFKFE